jgi:hypothetical protein
MKDYMQLSSAELRPESVEGRAERTQDAANLMAVELKYTRSSIPGANTPDYDILIETFRYII